MLFVIPFLLIPGLFCGPEYNNPFDPQSPFYTGDDHTAPTINHDTLYDTVSTTIDTISISGSVTDENRIKLTNSRSIKD